MNLDEQTKGLVDRVYALSARQSRNSTEENALKQAFFLNMSCLSFEARVSNEAVLNLLCHLEDTEEVDLDFMLEAYAMHESEAIAVTAMYNVSASPTCRQCGQEPQYNGVPLSKVGVEEMLKFALYRAMGLSMPSSEDDVSLCTGCGLCSECHKEDESQELLDEWHERIGKWSERHKEYAYSLFPDLEIPGELHG